MRYENIEKYLKIVEEKLENDFDVSVEYIEGIGNSFFFYEEYIIEVGLKQDKENILYALLHEAGHVILFETNIFTKRKSYLKRYRKKYKVDVLREEIFAWEKGLELAQNLNIPINMKEWEKVRVNSLYEYILWANNPEKYEKV